MEELPGEGALGSRMRAVWGSLPHTQFEFEPSEPGVALCPA